MDNTAGWETRTARATTQKQASGERETRRGQPDLFGHTMSGQSWGPHKVATLWGKEKQTEWLSFRAYTEAKDTQFVST